MAMFKKVKDWLGIEGVKLVLDVPETIDIDTKTLKGHFTISTQSAQYLEEITFTLKERYRRGRRKSKLIDEYVLGKMTLPLHMQIQPTDVVHRPFEIRFDEMKSGMDRFGDRNILYKGISALAKLVKNAKSEYFILAEVSVKGNRLKPYDQKELVAQ